MKTNILFSGKTLFMKIALLAALIVGGGNNAWADTVIFDASNENVTSGWAYTRTYNENEVSATLSSASNYCLVNYNTTSGPSWYTSTGTIVISSGQKIVLSAKKYGSSNYGSVKVFYSSDNGTNYIQAKEFTYSNGDLTANYKDLEVSNVVGTYKIRFEFLYSNIRTITIVDPVGGTPAPTSFSYSDVAYNSASLSWTPGGEETQWQIRWNKDSDFDPAKEEGTLVDYSTVTNPYSLTDLSESTTYYAYVRAYIDEGTQSDWAGPVSFTTPEQYPTPTGLTASNLAGSGTEATLSWTDGVGTTASKWQIRYSTSSAFDPEKEEGTLVNNISTNPYTLTGLTANETYYACVRADYSDNTENHYSDWTDKISFTPIEAWEDFSNGIPDTWYNYNSGFVTNRSGYEGQAYSSSSSNVLRTPRLYASKDDELNFYVTLGGGSMTARYYKNSRSSYTTISSYSTSGQKTFVAPSDGYYWIEFTNAYNGAVDNFSGFSIADTENLMELGTKSIPSTGIVGGDYTAWVTLRELGGNNETYTAQLYYDGEVVAEKEGETINGNRTETASLTFTPSVVKTSKPMYIKIIYNNGERELTTASENVTMSTTSYVFDETGAISRPASTIYNSVVQLKYTAQHGWNTICVPFLLTDTYLEQIFGEGYTVYKINSFINGVLYFQKTTSYAVSTPYLVYAENEDKVAENIYLKGVGYNTSNDNSANKTQTKGTGTTASFIGTFDPITGMAGKYGVTTAGKLGKGSDKASIKGYRAYIETSEPEARLSIVIDDDGETTDLGFVRMVDKDAKDVYNLQGQKVKKSGKGIYVVNGRKVVIK